MVHIFALSISLTVATTAKMHCTSYSNTFFKQAPSLDPGHCSWLHQQRALSRPLCSVPKLTRRNTTAVNASTSAPTADALLEAVQGQRLGAASTPQQRQQLLQVVEDLKKLKSTPSRTVAPTEGPLAGQWQLLWTSEASVHSIVNGQLLGAPVTNIYQHIDLQSQRVTNTINFGWFQLQLQASGPLRVLSPSRIYYSFDQLSLRVFQLQLPLPVFFKGGGWTDCVLLLDEGQLRVMENSRGDTLVLQQVADDLS